MNDDRAQDALALAEAALAHAEREGASEAEALVMAEDAALTRFANSEIHQNVAETNVVVNLRFVLGKRVGVASSGRTDDEGLRRLAANAAAIAGVVEELEDWGGLPAGSPAEDVEAAYSRATADASPESRADGVRQVIAAADAAGVVAYGSFATGTETFAVANSTGARQSGTRTVAQLLTVSMGPDGGTGYAESAAVDSTTIDAAAIGRESADKARATANAVAIDAGRLPGRPRGVRRRRHPRHARLPRVLRPGRPGGAQLRRARPADRLGARDHRRRRARPARASRSGSTSRASPSSACRWSMPASAGAWSMTRRPRRATACSRPVTACPPRTRTARSRSNMVMDAGTTSRDDLVAGLDRGLLVTRFHYTNPVHPKLAIVTGMTRDGTFLVEDGRIVAPVRNLRYTQSYLDALAGTVAVAPRPQDPQGLPRRGRRPGDPRRRLDLHGHDRALTA